MKTLLPLIYLFCPSFSVERLSVLKFQAATMRTLISLVILAATEAAAKQNAVGESPPPIVTKAPAYPPAAQLQEIGLGIHSHSPLGDELKKRQNVQTCALLNGDPGA